MRQHCFPCPRAISLLISAILFASAALAQNMTLTLAITGTTSTTATLTATVNPNGASGSVDFAYSSQVDASGQLCCDIITLAGGAVSPNNSPQQVSATLIRLVPGKTYYAYAYFYPNNLPPKLTSGTVMFATLTIPLTLQVTGTTSTTATLTATVNPNGAGGPLSFAHSSQLDVNGQLCCDIITQAGGTVNPNSSPQQISATLTGLVPGKTYYAYAYFYPNGFAPRLTSDTVMFATLTIPLTLQVTGTTSTTATLTGTVNPNGASGRVDFAYSSQLDANGQLCCDVITLGGGAVTPNILRSKSQLP